MYEFLGYQAQDVMSTDLTVVAPETPLREVEEIFDRHDFNGLPVVDAPGEMVGFMTKLDLLRAFRFGDEHMFPPYEEIMKRPVESVMRRDVRTVTPRTPLTRVLEKLVGTAVKSFPVLDPDGRLVGIVSREDVLRALRRAAAGEEAPTSEERDA